MGKFYRNREEKRGRKTKYKKVYIFCEGKTEENYFNGISKSIRRAGIVNVIVEELGAKDLKYLAEKALKVRGLSSLDEVWVVFDYDNKNGFDDVIQRLKSTRKKYRIEIAYSNLCFEKWFLLHFKYSTSGETAKSYYKELTNYFSKLDPKITDYEKNGKAAENLYELIKDHQETAINRAKKLEKHCDSVGQTKPSERIPSTKVYKLVESLNALKD